MSVGSNELYFSYDGMGNPLKVLYNGTQYHYVTNLQGDVLRILDEDKNTVVEYTYDAWGNLISTTGTKATTLGVHNPLRYRGYVYDVETGLYYLQSRYYNPAMGRFVNADAFASTGQGVLGNNMFAYCNNNPINFVDPSGYIRHQFAWELFDGGGGGSGFVADALTAGTVAGLIITGPSIIEILSTISENLLIPFKQILELSQEFQILLKEKQKTKKYQYWEAVRIGGNVVIGQGLTIGEASIRVANGLDIMCANYDAAKWILILNGYFSAVGPEIHGGEGYFSHFHPNRHSHTHIWFFE